MSIFGALCLATSVTCAVMAIRSTSPVARHLATLRPPVAAFRMRSPALVSTDALQGSGLDVTADQLLAAKIVAALAMLIVAAVISVVLPIGPLVLGLAAYAGFIAPTLFVERVAARARRTAEVAVGALVEWTHALVLAGRPVESALVTVGRRGTDSVLVDTALRRAIDLYVLGAPLYVSIVREAAGVGVAPLIRLAQQLERSREMGQGSLAVLEDLRDELRAAGRDRMTQAASQVEGKLTVILTLCYLPALALLVVIPLFLTLLAGLFG